MNIGSIVKLEISPDEESPEEAIEKAVNEWFGDTSRSAPGCLYGGAVYVFGSEFGFVHNRQEPDGRLAFERKSEADRIAREVFSIATSSENGSVLIAAAVYGGGKPMLEKLAEHDNFRLVGYGMNLLIKWSQQPTQPR